MENIFSQIFLQYAQNKMITTRLRVIKYRVQSNFIYKNTLLLGILIHKNNI